RSLDLVWWCEVCDPYQLGALAGKLEIIQSWWDALSYSTSCCSDLEGVFDTVVMELARAKGFPEHGGEMDVAVFFGASNAIRECYLAGKRCGAFRGVSSGG